MDGLRVLVDGRIVSALRAGALVEEDGHGAVGYSIAIPRPNEQIYAHDFAEILPAPL